MSKRKSSAKKANRRRLEIKLPKRFLKVKGSIFTTLDKFKIEIITAIGMIILISPFFIPVSYLKAEQTSIKGSVEFKNEASIELGTEKVAKEGKDGIKETRFKYSLSLFDYLFRKDQAVKTEFDSRVTQQPEATITLKGTRKWQYMMCSNGTYRYYTDEQFKNPGVGFTSKSPDSCAENQQGHKLGLADSPSGTSNNTTPSYVPPNCQMITIPYSTVYEDVSWLYVGETQEGYGGINGFKYICSDGSFDTSYDPVDKIIYRGTDTKPTYNPPTTTYEQGPDYSAKYKCDSDYSYAKAQLSINGASGSSAMEYVKQLYAQCLARAGF